MNKFPVSRMMVVVLGLFLGGRVERAQADDQARNLYQQTVKAAVWVRCGEGSGSGWVADRKRKLIVTNHHVVEDQDEARIYFPVWTDGDLVVEKSAYAKMRHLRARVIDIDISRD